jgi:glutathione-regulated potassium-efflux system protein KefB
VPARVLPADSAAILTAVVTLSLAFTSLVFGIAQRLVSGSADETREADFSAANGNALIIGFGRFGQVVSQILLARGVEITMIDHRVEAIDAAERYGIKIHYGDGSKLDILKAAGAGKAELICVCVDDTQAKLKIVDFCREQFPMAKLMVRSFDRDDSLVLAGRNVDYHVRETFESAVKLGEGALAALGATDNAVEELITDFRRRDTERYQRQLVEGVYAGTDFLNIKPAVGPTH